MTIGALWSRFIDWLKMRRRSERRTAPYGVRGRIYEKREPVKAARSKPTATMRTRVIRPNSEARKDGHSL